MLNHPNGLISCIPAVGGVASEQNLMLDATYVWWVEIDGERSEERSFHTDARPPRFLCVDGISNVRDFGGFLTDTGKRVAQNRIFRTAELDTHGAITPSGRVTLEWYLGIRTDLDLRGGHARPLGNTVQLISVPMQWYEHIFEADMHEHVRRSMATFAHEENYPILFHCSLGRDRTGTTAFLLLGLLGVDEDTLRHEYFASFFSQEGHFDEAEFPLLVTNINRMLTEMNAYGDKNDPLSEKIELYLLDIGVTPEEIRSIWNIWLED
jgi:hypothetical protein